MLLFKLKKVEGIFERIDLKIMGMFNEANVEMSNLNT
jgi:hypothetical protein